MNLPPFGKEVAMAFVGALEMLAKQEKHISSLQQFQTSITPSSIETAVRQKKDGEKNRHKA